MHRCTQELAAVKQRRSGHPSIRSPRSYTFDPGYRIENGQAAPICMAYNNTISTTSMGFTKDDGQNNKCTGNGTILKKNSYRKPWRSINIDRVLRRQRIDICKKICCYYKGYRSNPISGRTSLNQEELGFPDRTRINQFGLLEVRVNQFRLETLLGHTSLSGHCNDKLFLPVSRSGQTLVQCDKMTAESGSKSRHTHRDTLLPPHFQYLEGMEE